MKCTIGYLAAAFAMAVVVGCNTDTAVVGGRYDTVRTYPNITLSQRTLEDALGFQEPIVKRTANNLMHVTITVRSLSNEELHVEYRMVWLNEAGQPITPQMTWTPLRMDPRQPQRISITSTSPHAQDYNLQLRWGRP